MKDCLSTRETWLLLSVFSLAVDIIGLTYVLKAAHQLESVSCCDAKGVSHSELEVSNSTCGFNPTLTAACGEANILAMCNAANLDDQATANGASLFVVLAIVKLGCVAVAGLIELSSILWEKVSAALQTVEPDCSVTQRRGCCGKCGCMLLDLGATALSIFAGVFLFLAARGSYTDESACDVSSCRSQAEPTFTHRACADNFRRVPLAARGLRSRLRCRVSESRDSARTGRDLARRLCARRAEICRRHSGALPRTRRSQAEALDRCVVPFALLSRFSASVSL